MSTSLSIASIIEKNKVGSATPFLVCLDIGVIDPVSGNLVETLYVVRNNENVLFEGRTYTAASFDIEMRSEAGAQQSITLMMRDLTRAVQGRMQQYGGGVGFTVRLVVVNADDLTQPAEIVEFFDVVGASAQNYIVSFELGSENSIMQPFPRRRQTRDFCQWRYRGDECGYTGFLAACDLSLQGPNGCGVHNNSIRFGGFPGLTSSGFVRG